MSPLEAEPLSLVFFIVYIYDASVCTFRQMSFTACIQRSLSVNRSALKVTDRVALHDRSHFSRHFILMVYEEYMFAFLRGIVLMRNKNTSVLSRTFW
jgi:hypothetical protein